MQLISWGVKNEEAFIATIYPLRILNIVQYLECLNLWPVVLVLMVIFGGIFYGILQVISILVKVLGNESFGDY